MLFKRLICLALAAFMSLSFSASAEQADGQAYVMAGFDQTQYRDWNTNQFFARMEELTGIHFTFRQFQTEDAWEKEKAAMDSSGAALPDVLFKASLSSSEVMSLREKGVLIDLKPYLEENCPHLWAILKENPDLLSGLTLPDGSIAALPFISIPSMQNYLWINTEWLSSLRLEAPTTAQELISVLTAFRDRDPNRNGRKDEIPLGFLGPFDLKFLAHAFGMICNDYNVFAKDGEARFMPLEDNYRLFVTWCHDLYKEGLLDKNGFAYTDEMRTVTDSKATPTFGMILTAQVSDIFKVSWSEKYSIMMPLSFNGEKVYRSFSGPLLRGTFAVTSACKEPEKMLQWVDHLYTEEGAILAGIGKENEDYLVDGDGTWRFLEGVQNNYDFFRADRLIDGGAVHPGILARDFEYKMSGAAVVQDILDKQSEFDRYVKMPFPYYYLTKEQEEKLSPLQQKLGYYVDMQLARWVLGEEEISDESFRNFEAELKNLGLDEFMSIWQDVLNNQ